MKVWDLHCDTLYELRRAEKAGAPKSFLHNDLHIDLEKLRQGDYLLQCFAAYVDLADPAPGADYVKKQNKMFSCTNFILCL